MQYIETHIVEHCNLHCKGCSHFSGLAQPQFKSIDEFKKDFEQLATLTNHNIDVIRIMGGEPLLHPKLEQFFIIARSLFPNSSMVLVSNGILLNQLTDEQINTLNSLHIELCISEYGLKIDRSKMRKFNRFYYHNKVQLYNVSLDLNGSQDFIKSYQNCDLVNGKWYFLKNGRIYQCCVMANIDYFCNHFQKKIDYNLDDISIDIYSHTLDEIENFLRTPHQICRYCDTIARKHSYCNFEVSKEDIKEWII